MKQGLLSIWRALTWPWRRFPKTVGGPTGLVALLGLIVVGSNAYILLTTDGEATRRGRRAARRSGDRAGALVNPNGQMSGMLADRVKEASPLWHPAR